MDNPKISIIVPVYNVEKYLDRCVQSLVSQTYDNLEIILVDDGSLDSCPAICDEWASKDNRIKVIHKENSGVSSSRNAGLKLASGDYIGFVDGDDFVDIDMYEKLLNAILQNNSDMSVCGYKNFYDDKNISKKVHEINLKKLEKNDFYPYFLKIGFKNKDFDIETENIMGSVWRCLFNKKRIQNLTFREDIFICEDLILMLQVFKQNLKISVVEECLYNYVQRKTSSSHSFSARKMDNRILSYKMLIDQFQPLVTSEEIGAYKYHIYSSLISEVLRYNEKKYLKKLATSDFMKSLTNKENYVLAKKNCKIKSYKIAYYMIYHKLYFLYSMLVKIMKK